MYAGVAPHRALALYAVIAYLDSVAGVYFPRGGIHAVPARAGRRRRQARRARSATAPRSPGRDRTRGRARRGAHRPGERIAGRRGGAQPGPAGRLPGPAARRRPPATAPAALLTLLRGAARRLAPARTRKIAHHNLHFGRAWRRTFDEVIRQRPADARPVAAGHQPDPDRPDARAGRPADLLRARPGAEPAPAAPTAATGASGLGAPVRRRAHRHPGAARLRRLRRRRRGVAGSSPRPTGRDRAGRRHAVRRRAHASARPARSGPATCTRHCPMWSSSARARSRASACRWC